MREYAIVKKHVYIDSPVGYILKKVEIHETEYGLMTYLYDAVDDTALFHNDLMFGDLEETKEHCLVEYGIKSSDWIAVGEQTE